MPGRIFHSDHVLRSPFLRYGLAFGAIGIAIGLSLLAQHYQLRDLEVPLYLLASAVATWYGGTGPAVVAFVLSCVSFDYLFTEPFYRFAISRADLPYFAVFASLALLVSWFGTVRRRIESDLREARDNLQIEVAERTQQASLLDLTHDSIFVRDMNSRVTYWNRGAEELYGWSSQEAVGKGFLEFLPTDFPLPIEQINSELLKTGRWDGELTRTKADGARVVVASRWSVRLDDQGRAAAILETSNDITERKTREDKIERLNQELARRSTELEGTNKELEAFAYSVSHDLRAPLRHMSGYAELLQKRIGPSMDDKSNRYMAMILDSAKRMGNLIDDLLAFSRIGRAETQKSLVSLEQLTKEALSEIRQETEGRDIRWKIGSLPNLYGDRSMMRLVLINLLSNAAKFTRTRTPAEIEVGYTNGDPHEVIVFVKDNGVGFDMRYVNKLFGVFQRLHRSETFEGTGIGLATVQRIVHRHGGRVWAEGVLDGGATFYFSAPKP